MCHVPHRGDLEVRRSSKHSLGVKEGFLEEASAGLSLVDEQMLSPGEGEEWRD